MADSAPAPKTPPHNLEAERSILGAVLLDNGIFDQILDVVQDSDFYREANRKIFAAMRELSRRGEAIDYLTLEDYLQGRKELEAVGGATYLAALTDAVPSLANSVHYARIVRDKAIARRLMHAASEILQAGLEDRDDVQDYLDRAEQLIFQAAQRRQSEGVVPLKDIVRESFDAIDHIYEQKGQFTGVPTGFRDLDELTSGLQRSDLIILAGRPSMGKTSLALNMAHHAAQRRGDQDGLPTLFFSLEMSKQSLCMRLLCMEARVDFNRVRAGRLTDSDWPKLARAAGVLSEEAIFIDDTPAMRVMEMRAKARRLKAELQKQGRDLGLVMMDYLQLATVGGRIESREREISEISRSLKSLAKELDVPVVALSQLSRKPESRESKRPQMSDLRESGAIEQDADVILFIYRDEVYNQDSPEKGIAEVIVGKQRNGPIGTVKLHFAPEFTRFENLARERDF
ncbi:MAG: replicative DNA helicase [Deltaproteobacteria bacterium]|nr:MAG: replicative DNA helicase [Deltaproteobacteria bacterium]